jgi:hypothetical protein
MLNCNPPLFCSAQDGYKCVDFSLLDFELAYIGLFLKYIFTWPSISYTLLYI